MTAQVRICKSCGKQYKVYMVDSSVSKNCGYCTSVISGFTKPTNERIIQAKHNHYKKDVRHIDTLDIYWICDLYVKDDSGCIQHAVKKLLCAGERGVKDDVKDLQEAIDTIQCKIDMLKVKGNL